MTIISSNTLSGSESKTWKLDSLKVEVCDSEGNESIQTFTDFTEERFLNEFGGYAFYQITFFENRNFKAIYKTEEGDISAEGRWNVNDQHIILEQSTGDKILLLAPKYAGELLTVGYEFLSFNYGIKELKFSAL